MSTYVAAAPFPSPIQRRTPVSEKTPRSEPTPVPRASPRIDSVADDVLAFYRPLEDWARSHASRGDWDGFRDEESGARLKNAMNEAYGAADALARNLPSPTRKRSDVPSVPLSQMGPPSFPPDIPSW